MEKPWTCIFCTEVWSSSSKGAGGYFETLSVSYTGLSYTEKKEYVQHRVASLFPSCAHFHFVMVGKLVETVGPHPSERPWYMLSSQMLPHCQLSEWWFQAQLCTELKAVIIKAMGGYQGRRNR